MAEDAAPVVAAPQPKAVGNATTDCPTPANLPPAPSPDAPCPSPTATAATRSVSDCATTAHRRAQIPMRWHPRCAVDAAIACGARPAAMSGRSRRQPRCGMSARPGEGYAPKGAEVRTTTALIRPAEKKTLRNVHALAGPGPGGIRPSHSDWRLRNRGGSCCLPQAKSSPESMCISRRGGVLREPSRRV